MKCPNCKTTLSLKNNRCDRCGEDVRVYKKVIKASNAFYNQGLAKARVRDLSGAVIALHNSLELYKYNTNARNLLGLVYYEMGETVNALSQWVISRHLEPDENVAEEYIAEVQSNATKLEATNQSIKKYNAALIAAEQGNLDLAIIQLKKVISINSNFLRAYQLLALIYIKHGEKDKARKLLVKANQIDLNNTTTLRYLKACGSNITKHHVESIEKEPVVAMGQRKILKNENPDYAVFSNLNKYKEDKPDIWKYLNLLIGVVVGICVTYFLITPQVRKSQDSQLQSQINQKVDKISQLTSDNTSLTNERDTLLKQVADLQAELTGESGTENNGKDPIADTAYTVLFDAVGSMLAGKGEEAAIKLSAISATDIKAETAIAVYNTIKEQTFVNASKTLYNEGHALYTKNKFEDALVKLEQAYKLNPEDENVLYFLGRSYQQTEQIDKAKEYYLILVEQYPTTNRGKQAQQQLNGLE